MANAENTKIHSHYDIFIIGGGVNGAGIARDAAGRGFSVCLCEQGDFASGTSSASTKLFHGGLRYLEYFEFRLVREALMERETLLMAMPHISWPMRFVLPLHRDMRFESGTPASNLLGWMMPWLKGRRPNWMIRLGLFFYDHIGGRKFLPATRTLDLKTDPAGGPLNSSFQKAYEYSDCWVDDARLVILNLIDANQRGAAIHSRTKVEHATYREGKWHLEVKDSGGKKRAVTADIIVNATGPWMDDVLKSVFGVTNPDNIRLVRGSHIVIPKKFSHDRCYFFQNADSRIAFTIPYEQDYTLIGTTDAEHGEAMHKPQITEAEIEYLCTAASAYFTEPVRPEDVVWTYSGVRPLYDDGTSKAQAATREYLIRPEPTTGDGTLLNVFGGKITTYRKLAESMMAEIETRLGKRGHKWTAGISLPGGNFPIDGFDQLLAKLSADYPFLPEGAARRLVRSYGTRSRDILGEAKSLRALGKHFGHGLYQAEVEYLMNHEWAQTAEDILFRRTKLGLRMSKRQINALETWLETRREFQEALLKVRFEEPR